MRTNEHKREIPTKSLTGLEGADRSITWNDLKEIAAQGNGIASHSVSHPRLAILDEPSIIEELEKSRDGYARSSAPSTPSPWSVLTEPKTNGSCDSRSRAIRSRATP